MTKHRWLILIHQIPRTPSYLRVKVWRRLQRLGAVAIKNSVYAIPASDQALEDLVWVMHEIEQGGGEASICEARFVEGLRDGQLEAMFNAARDVDYRAILDQARLLEEAAKSHNENVRDVTDRGEQIARLQKRFDEVAAIDFFSSPTRDDALKSLRRLQENSKSPAMAVSEWSKRSLSRKTWVTRKDVFVDRMACAWLIEKFIDPSARFKFVEAKHYKARPGEIRFDMFGGEFTHEGDLCTFEVLLQRLRLKDAGLATLGHIVHDIDLKDAKFGLPETSGVNRILQAITQAHRDDRVRLERSSTIFDDLYALFSKKRRG